MALLLILCLLSTVEIARAEGWLSGWDKRVKLMIDLNDISSDLSNFPVLIYLSTSSGRGLDDVSFIFDEIQSDANRKKIAVTTGDGTTQCYVEIERWDQAGEKAWLWAKVPSVSSTAYTILYLYYDRDHADNTAYVGDTGSTPAQTVWGTFHKGVWHLSEGGTGTRYDSTSNANNANPSGYEGDEATTGMIGGADNLEGTNDYLKTINDIGITGNGVRTISFWVKLDTTARNGMVCLGNGSVGQPNNGAFEAGVRNTNYILWAKGAGNDWENIAAAKTGAWHYYTIAYDSTTAEWYEDGSFISGFIHTYNTLAGPAYFGYENDNNEVYSYMDGIIDEVRISSTAWGSAWIKACYESERDHLIDFEIEETCGSSSSYTAFVDGGSMAIQTTSNTTLATLCTSFAACDSTHRNFVIAIVQFECGATDVTISNGGIGYLVLQRTAGTVRTLMSNFYNIRLSSGSADKQKWYALMGLDPDAGANPTYAVKVLANGASAAGAYGEAKILAIGGLNGAEAPRGTEATIDTSETALCTFSQGNGQSLPAGDNVVIALFETKGYQNSGTYYLVEYLRRGTFPGTYLTQSEMTVSHGPDGTYGDWQVQLMPYYDVGQGSNPTYTASAGSSAKNKIKGVAKIIAFNKPISDWSIAYSDGASTSIQTSETNITTLSTAFQTGSEVVVIASEQFIPGGTYTRSISAGYNKLQQNNQAGSQTSNQFTLYIRESANGDTGEGFGLLNRFTSTPANPAYEVKATASATVLYGESKLLALSHKPPGPAPELPMGPTLALIVCLPIFFAVRKRAKA